jgi:trigger factor
MDIVKEVSEDLTATVHIKLTPADYEGKVNEQIKKTQKTANMPGFRKGMVPTGMIRKMYGKAILFDELNKLVSESLEKYITENQIEILGNPIPQPLKELDTNWEKPLDYEFAFDLGLAPTFDLQLPPATALPFYEIQVDEKKIDEYLEDIRNRHGTFSNPETADVKSILYGHFEELDTEGKVKENGIKNTTTLFIEFIKDEETKNKFIGSKTGDVFTVDIQKAFDHNATEISAMLAIKKDLAAILVSSFQYTIESVNSREPAEINQELFDKVYGEGKVTSEQEFRDRLKNEIAEAYKLEGERKLQHDLEDVLLDEVKFTLPDNFLKRWMLTLNEEKPVTPEQLENEYPHHARGIKWRLIENKIFRENNLTIEDLEVLNFARQVVFEKVSRYGSQFTDEETINRMADTYLKKTENLNFVMESITGRKVFQFLNAIITKDIKKVSEEEFKKIVTEHHH